MVKVKPSPVAVTAEKPATSAAPKLGEPVIDALLERYPDLELTTVKVDS